MEASIYAQVASSLRAVAANQRLDADILRQLAETPSGLAMDGLLDEVRLSLDDHVTFQAIGWDFSIMASLCRLACSGLIYPAGASILDWGVMPAPHEMRATRWVLTDLAKSVLHGAQAPNPVQP